MRNNTFKLMLLALPMFSVSVNASSDVSVVSYNDLITVHQTTASNYAAGREDLLQYTQEGSRLEPSRSSRDLKAEAIYNFQQDGSFFKLADMNSADSIY